MVDWRRDLFWVSVFEENTVNQRVITYRIKFDLDILIQHNFISRRDVYSILLFGKLHLYIMVKSLILGEMLPIVIEQQLVAYIQIDNTLLTYEIHTHTYY